jgi:hypothetical protein
MSVTFYALAGNDGARPINLDDPDSPRMHNVGAAVVLRAMGLIESEDELWSPRPVEIATFRRGTLLALNTERPEAGAVAPSQDGRCYCGGASPDYIRHRLYRLAEWAEQMAAQGAREIYWA